MIAMKSLNSRVSVKKFDQIELFSFIREMVILFDSTDMFSLLFFLIIFIHSVMTKNYQILGKAADNLCK